MFTEECIFMIFCEVIQLKTFEVYLHSHMSNSRFIIIAAQRLKDITPIIAAQRLKDITPESPSTTLWVRECFLLSSTDCTVLLPVLTALFRCHQATGRCPNDGLSMVQQHLIMIIRYNSSIISRYSTHRSSIRTLELGHQMIGPHWENQSDYWENMNKTLVIKHRSACNPLRKLSHQ